ncbi:MAG: hypothetical protein V9G04_08445 [Nocardioides sp.]|jgi:hypothetical protein
MSEQRLQGTCAFRLYPTDDLAAADSFATVEETGAEGLVLRYGWTHADDGGQTGAILVGKPAEDGALRVAWTDGWHQPEATLLTGSGDARSFEVSYEYAPGWHWSISLRAHESEIEMVMRNQTPPEVADPTPYDVMVARWEVAG